MISNHKRPYLLRRPNEDLGDISGHRYVRGYFENCTIKASKGVELVHCCTRNARMVSNDLRDYIGMTVTLNCDTFENLEMPPLAFDALLKLLSIMRGNDAKREGLRRLIDPVVLRRFDLIFPDLE